MNGQPFDPASFLAGARRASAVGATACLLVAGAANAQTAEQLNVRALAATCANCHGTDGQAVAGTTMVRIAGMPRDYLASQMRAFRDGQRPATIMHQLAKGYSNEQIDAIAAFLSAPRP